MERDGLCAMLEIGCDPASSTEATNSINLNLKAPSQHNAPDYTPIGFTAKTERR